MRWLCVVAMVASGCATSATRLRGYQASYEADTAQAERRLEPLRLEASHGQLTVAMTQSFAQKLLAGMLRSMPITLEVEERGQVWRSQGKHLGIAYDNGVWLTRGQVQLHAEAERCILDADVARLQASLHGEGSVTADLRFYGVPVTRDIGVTVHAEQPLSFKLAAGDAAWSLKPDGAPFHVQIGFKTAALTVGSTSMLEVNVDRSLEIPLARFGEVSLPWPAPRVVHLGTQSVAVDLAHRQVGARSGALWLSGDVVPAQPSR